MEATKVKDYGRFTIYKSNARNDRQPFFAEGKTGRGISLDATATLEELEKYLDRIG
jgi:hypothetical protein